MSSCSSSPCSKHRPDNFNLRLQSTPTYSVKSDQIHSFFWKTGFYNPFSCSPELLATATIPTSASQRLPSTSWSCAEILDGSAPKCHWNESSNCIDTRSNTQHERYDKTLILASCSTIRTRITTRKNAKWACNESSRQTSNCARLECAHYMSQSTSFFAGSGTHTRPSLDTSAPEFLSSRQLLLCFPTSKNTITPPIAYHAVRSTSREYLVA